MEPRYTLGRRQFLRIIGAGSVAGMAAFALNRQSAPARASVTETRVLMGTLVNLTLVTTDRQAGERAVKACLDHMAGLEAVMSRHQSSSQLSRLNRQGYLDNPDANLVHVLRESQRLSALTDGAFDVTVRPLIDLYQDSHNRDGSLPSSRALESALARVGYQHLNIDPQRLSFARPGMAVTLDGIAKGYIVDEGAAVLRQHGFDNILVEAGGDLASSGERSSGESWQIGIQRPRASSSAPLNTFSISNRAAATSGDYMHTFADDFAAHHIIDPRRGRSSTELASATVVAASAMLADALATALMVMDSGSGLSLVESLAGCEAHLITKDLRIRQSSGWL